jgi:hypothetical protein
VKGINKEEAEEDRREREKENKRKETIMKSKDDENDRLKQ